MTKRKVTEAESTDLQSVQIVTVFFSDNAEFITELKVSNEKRSVTTSMQLSELLHASSLRKIS